MSEEQVPRVTVDGEELVGCVAEDKSDGAKPATEEAAIKEEERLATLYAKVEEDSDG